MMNTWQQILNILEGSVPEPVFKVWLQPLEAELEKDKLWLRARNDFMAGWIREKFLAKIQEASAEVLGFIPEIKIEAKKQKKFQPVLAELNQNSAQAHLPILPEVRSSCVFRYYFEDFVVGPSNELAFLASKSFSQNQVSTDQLFLCSAPGLGKTHLVHSVGTELLKVSNKSRLKIAYLTAEEFASQLVSALRSKQMELFKAKFRQNIDVLLIEDIHFFQNKQKLQDEFLCTIKSLTEQGKKVVFSSTFLPKELEGLDAQLVSRLCQGFLAVINRPDQETLLRIIEHKSKKMQISIPKDVGEYLACSVNKDIRQLESCLLNLILKARLLKRNVDLSFAQEVVRQFKPNKGQEIDLDFIIKRVAQVFTLPEEALVSKSRKKDYVLARSIIFYLARKHTDLSLGDIGQRFNRKHSTVLKGIAKIERECSRNTPLGRQIKQSIKAVFASPS